MTHLSYAVDELKEALAIILCEDNGEGRRDPEWARESVRAITGAIHPSAAAINQ